MCYTGNTMFLHKVIRMNQNRAVVLPQTLARSYGIEWGDYVSVSGTKNGILIQKVIRVEYASGAIAIRHDPGAKT